MKAYQRIIRENQAEKQETDLFGAFWHDIDLSLINTTIKEVDFKTAQKIILEHEWIGTMPLPKSCRFIYGIYFEGFCGGVAVYVEPSTRQFNKDYPRQAVQLNRGACVHWTPHNTASYFLSKTFKLLKEQGIKIIVAYCTQEAGEIGIIYQSLNFIYTGETTKSNVYWLDNHWISERTLADKIKWAKYKPEYLEAFNNLDKKELKPKYKYMMLIGNKTENKEIINTFGIERKEYPKRFYLTTK